MYRSELQDDEDLRVEIFHLKKQLSNVEAENHLLKVKIRKLQNEIIKKDRQMDVVLDPRKSTDVRKILYERSASFVLNMKEKNDELLHLLHEKNIIIRRLQNQLEVAKLYSQPPKKQFSCKCSDHVDLDNKIRQIQVKATYFQKGSFSASTLDDNNKKKKIRSLSWTPGLREAESTLIEDVDINDDGSSEQNKSNQGSSYDVKDQYKSLSRDHLLSIIESLKNQRYSPSSRQTTSRKSSPESDLERIELLCESPHEEIQQLHLHFLDMISEVDHLKNTIAQLQNNQEKTDNVLKNKNTNIDKLVQELKNLKRPKSKSGRNRGSRNYSSADTVARVYSANNYTHINRTCSKLEKEKRTKHEKDNKKDKKSNLTAHNRSEPKPQKHKNYMTDAMTQVDKIESTENANHCVYIEKSSITIAEKKESSSSEKEFAYDDDIFENCDEDSNTPI